MFVKANPKLSTIEAVWFWKRFIDDCIGIWRGTQRAFYAFLNQLNEQTMKYGIKFPIGEVQFGKSVHNLDLCVYLDDENRVHYKGYSKPTDAKRYLNPTSFHPEAVFNSIPFSQMLRVLRNNSKEETMNIELDQCIQTFRDSGYKNNLLELKDRALNKVNNRNVLGSDRDTLVFPVHYFEGVKEFKSVLYDLKDEITELIGDTKVMFAMRKGTSLGNALVRNKQLSRHENIVNGQKCNGRGCLQCPLVNKNDSLTINGNTIKIPRNLNCKTRNIIYMWICKLCGLREVYFGRSIQECHDRTSGHRNCFNEEKWDKSALSMHAKDVHQMSFSLDIFSIAVIKKVSPQYLRREEFKFIDKYRTNSLGLNRYKK